MDKRTRSLYAHRKSHCICLADQSTRAFADGLPVRERPTAKFIPFNAKLFPSLASVLHPGMKRYLSGRDNGNYPTLVQSARRVRAERVYAICSRHISASPSDNKIVRSAMKLSTHSAAVRQYGAWYLNQVGQPRVANTRIFRKRSNYYSSGAGRARAGGGGTGVGTSECSFGYLILLEVRHLSRRMQSAFERVRCG